jgi:uncharacterized Zn finger protein (UPF0148 family)
MVYFALSANKALATNIVKIKKLTHAECESSLVRLDDGQCFCPVCHKTGYPVKRL